MVSALDVLSLMFIQPPRNVNPERRVANGQNDAAEIARAATDYCQSHGQLSFNIPFTKIPVAISVSVTALAPNYGSTNDMAVVVPTLPLPSVGASLDVTINAPSNPTPSVNVGAGRNLSVGTFLTAKGPHGFTFSVGPSIGPPVTFALPAGNGCGYVAGTR